MDKYNLKSDEEKTKTIKIEIPGQPVHKKRHRWVNRGKHAGAYSTQTTEVKQIQAIIKKQIGQHKPYAGALSFSAYFIMERPKNHYGTGKNTGKLKLTAPMYHIKKPDSDNLEKFYKDCMNKIVYFDDSQFVLNQVSKIYTREGEEPKTIIYIAEVS